MSAGWECMFPSLSGGKSSEESERKWAEQQKLNQEMLAEIRRVDKKIDTKIGAIGVRWGIDSETAFRNSLRGIFGRGGRRTSAACE